MLLGTYGDMELVDSMNSWFTSGSNKETIILSAVCNGNDKLYGLVEKGNANHVFWKCIVKLSDIDAIRRKI
jgi:hypothetical protein